MKPALVTGDRPTGRLHVGHLLGSLLNRLRLQETHSCYFLVADLHMLTTHAERTDEMKRNTTELVLDWLSVGLDPARAVFYLQSQVPAVSELFAILCMLCSVPRAQRIPTLKEKAGDENYSARLRHLAQRRPARPRAVAERDETGDLSCGFRSRRLLGLRCGRRGRGGALVSRRATA